MEKVLKQIEQYADKAHGQQTRKYSPERYIVHPVRVMEMCRVYTEDISVLSAALLHDVLEDTNISKETLGDFLNTILNAEEASRTLQLVEELTDVYIKKDFPLWNRRKRKMKEAERIENTSKDSQTIKYADIIDNCPEITEKDPEFAVRFLRECRLLLKRMKKGNKDLYLKAVKTVNDCLEKLKETSTMNSLNKRL
jgi:(p)ppGpp synthase/HD superfamily hydrolase